MADPTEASGTGPLLKNRYRLGRVLGRGGMCIVYQAWDTKLQRDVAIKRLEPPLNQDPRTRARFDREGRALARLSHPNVVTLIDRGSTESDDYLVFEYVEGRSLKEMVKEAPLTVEDAGRILGQVAEGLATAHQAGIVHRDVKPQNILIDRNGHAKITDFGIATGPDWTRVTKAGSIIGSARYMSPEQVRSKPVDVRSDIYSLGIVAYEMLAGHPPFDGANMPEIARHHLNTAPAPLSALRSDLPPGLEKIVMRCLEKLPEDRFVSMDELLGALMGLGLYGLTRTEVTGGRQKRATDDERRQRVSPGGASLDSGSHQKDAAGDDIPSWQRDRQRRRAKQARSRRRLVIGGAAGAIVVVAVLVVVLVLVLSGGKAPSVVGLTLDQARQAAADSGLQVEVTARIPSFESSGVVLEQTPDAGIKTEDGVLQLTVSRAPTPVKVTEIKSYDPDGDQKENDDQLPNLIDGKESTSWSTELYKSAAFGNLGKSGVGLEFTLESPATIMEIVSAVDGWKGELRQETSGSQAKIMDLDGTNKIITLREPISSGRIWFTKLIELSSGRFGVELSEIRFYK